MQLEMKPTCGFVAGHKTEEFYNLYRIEEHWSASLCEIEDHAFRRVTRFLSTINLVDYSSNYYILVSGLGVLMIQTDLENLGKYRSLFNDEEIEIARERLDTYNSTI